MARQRLALEYEVSIKTLTVDATMNSNLDELTYSANKVLSDICGNRDEISMLVIRCEQVKDSSAREYSNQAVRAWEKVLRDLEMADSLIIYESEGGVFGYSFDLLLIADFRIIRKGFQLGLSRRIGATPPGMSLYRLANQAGQAQARRLSLAGRVLEADEAYSIGLADEISNGEVQAIDRAIEKFSTSPSSEFVVRRRLLLEAHTLEYGDALGAYRAARAMNRSRVGREEVTDILQEERA